MCPIEVLFRLEFKLSKSVVLPPAAWPNLRSKKTIANLIQDCPLELIISENVKLFKQYTTVLSFFDKTKPLSSLTDLANKGKYRICYARDLFSIVYPDRVDAFQKLHDSIWKKRITDNSSWQTELENAEFALMYGHAFDKFADMAEAEAALAVVDFPWRQLGLEMITVK